MTRKAWIYTGLVLLLTTAPVRAEFHGLDAFSYTQENYSYKPEAFSKADLSDFLGAKKPDNLDGFLTELVSDRPAMGRSVVALYQSHSLHRASFVLPRIILFASPETVLAYSTDPADPAYSKLEVLAFNPVTKRHSVHEVSFAPGRKPTLESPKACATCHGQSPKPLWDAYNFWAGAYGLRQSMHAKNLESHFDEATMQVVQREGGLHRLQPREYEHFTELRKNWPKSPRLSPLKPAVKQETSERVDFSDSPQFQLSLILYSQRYRELADRVVNAPFFGTFRPYFEKGLSGKRAHTEFARAKDLLPADLLEKIPFTPEQVSTWVRGNRQRVLKERFVRAYLPFKELEPSKRELYGYAEDFKNENTGIEDFLFLVEASGASTADWSPNYGRDAYLFQSGVYGTHDLLEGMRQALADLPPSSGAAPELPKDYASKVSGHFAEKSAHKAALRSLALQPVIARCQYCHTEPHLYGREPEKAAPFIPFHDSRAMSEKLKSPAFAKTLRKRIAAGVSDKERMPPTTMPPLSDAERESFEEYVGVLTPKTN